MTHFFFFIALALKEINQLHRRQIAIDRPAPVFSSRLESRQLSHTAEDNCSHTNLPRLVPQREVRKEGTQVVVLKVITTTVARPQQVLPRQQTHTHTLTLRSTLVSNSSQARTDDPQSLTLFDGYPYLDNLGKLSYRDSQSLITVDQQDIGVSLDL